MNKEIKFKIGDTVQLRTGGCLMTVEGYRDMATRTVECVWFDDCGELKRDNFEQGTLRRVRVED